MFTNDDDDNHTQILTNLNSQKKYNHDWNAYIEHIKNKIIVYAKVFIFTFFIDNKQQINIVFFLSLYHQYHSDNDTHSE